MCAQIWCRRPVAKLTIAKAALKKPDRRTVLRLPLSLSLSLRASPMASLCSDQTAHITAFPLLFMSTNFGKQQQANIGRVQLALTQKYSLARSQCMRALLSSPPPPPPPHTHISIAATKCTTTTDWPTNRTTSICKLCTARHIFSSLIIIDWFQMFLSVGNDDDDYNSNAYAHNDY